MDEKYHELAVAVTENIVDAGIALARRQQVRPKGFEGFCTCGEEVPTERVAQGRYNCVPCQTAIEQRTKFYSGG